MATADQPANSHHAESLPTTERAQVAENGPSVDSGAPPKPRKAKPKKPAKELAADRIYQIENYPALFGGEKPYSWQTDALKALGPRGSRVALRAANGSGKTSLLIVWAIMWHMLRFPGSQTVCTAGVYRQLSDVLWPELKKKTAGIGGAALGWDVTDGRVKYTAPGFEQYPAMCSAFSVSDPEKAEGWHARGIPDQPANLLYVVDEAKSVPDPVFHAMERCQPTRVLAASSPGGRAGAFFDIFRTADPRYAKFKVTAYDCPHITKEWIQEQIDRYGEKSALIQSMIFAEFGEEDGNSLILPPSVLQKAISSPPAKAGIAKRAGSDFAAGGDENVIAMIEGNQCKPLRCWREKDTMAAVGRFLTEYKTAGLEADSIWADGSGIGIPMCDALREAGYDVHRVNNGAAAHNPDKFANRGTEMWVEFARMVETGKVILPADDELLHRQLTTRRLLYNSKGKLIAESKDDMKKRGLSSPDRADAVVLAFTGAGASLDSYMAKFGRGPSLSDLDDDSEWQDAQGRGPMVGAHAG